MNIDPVIAFRDALQAAFGRLDWLPIPDSEIHRFHVPGDSRGTKAGWYCLFLDSLPAGAFGSWKVGGTHRWSSREPASPAEAEQVRQRIEQARQQRDAEQQRAFRVTQACALQSWRDAKPADPNHPYLIAKGCQPHGLRQSGRELLVPLIYAGQLINLQRIRADGTKRFLPGGRVKGCYSPIGEILPGQPLYLCEGWATGETIHEDTGCPVACAMNAGNLLAAGRHLRQQYPHARLILAGDDDRKTEAAGKGNPGRAAALATAEDLGCDFVFPPWAGDEPLALSDFNDLRKWRENSR